MGKMMVLKPVVWNDNGYTWPAGIPATSGYSYDHGYGHKEWHGRSDWVWNGWKLFHTEAKGQMHAYAADGSLGILMTTMREGRFFAVGVGCNVYENSPAEKVEIAEALDLKSYADDHWEVEAIRQRKRNRRALDTHWHNHLQINWRCPQTHYAWFGRPVPIVPNELIPAMPPRQAIVKMHGSYQAIRPDQALSIVTQTLPGDHPVIGWLSTDDFDAVRNSSVREAHAPKGGRRSAGTTTDPFVRYMQEYEVVVSPRHHMLQSDFDAFLRSAGAKGVKANIERVDLRFRDATRGPVLVEIKPTEPSTVRYAIRTAIGQLLDYHQRTAGTPAMMIVIDDEPSEDDAQLALSNGFAISWRAGTSFRSRWPSS